VFLCGESLAANGSSWQIRGWGDGAHRHVSLGHCEDTHAGAAIDRQIAIDRHDETEEFSNG